MGFSPKSLAIIQNFSAQPQGMVLITGPTGSGKTSTLYACMQAIKSDEVNIVTVEDPVEFELAGINQVQISEKVGLTFPYVLRSILRQDPNVIMIGEIRDVDTAEIALQSSLTGHLVLSTLHTNDAPSAITRLMDIGLAP
jgi:type II secretory ATPase GspE/PulE/Tfp pilus assembly ATPase PilB-like protein